MAWERSSPRPERSSRQWQQARRAALVRDSYQCRRVLPDGSRCPRTDVEVDHINQGDDHALENLMTLCVGHHKEKTDQEKTAARWRYRMARPKEPHPGLIT